MARRSRFGIQFDGFAELMEQYDKLGGDLREVATDCLRAAHDIVTPAVKQDMQKHRNTGDTEQSIEDHFAVSWAGLTASVDVGFDLKNGGVPSIFLMYGTPRTKKDSKLYNDIYGSRVRKMIAEEQERILRQAINSRVGGG